MTWRWVGFTRERHKYHLYIYIYIYTYIYICVYKLSAERATQPESEFIAQATVLQEVYAN